MPPELARCALSALNKANELVRHISVWKLFKILHRICELVVKNSADFALGCLKAIPDPESDRLYYRVVTSALILRSKF